MAQKKYLRLFSQAGATVIDLGDMEIWDGADMALLRETLTRLITKDKCRSIGVDMTFVKYIPSGFFGMLYDWYEQGVCVKLFSPQPNVQRMIWFTKFFETVMDGCHELQPEANPEFSAGYPTAGNTQWEAPRREKVAAASHR